MLKRKGPLSCQKYHISNQNLSITTTIQDHYYQFAGIKVLTPGYNVTGCTFYRPSGYCLFSVSNTISNIMSLIPVGSFTLLPTSLPAAVFNVGYSQNLSVNGGVPPYTYAVTSGALPRGLVLNSTTGEISGIPQSQGTYPFTITVTDSTLPTSRSASKAYSIVVAGVTLTLSPTSLLNASIGSSYSQTISANGGLSPYTYTVTAGALPTGLTLNQNTGVISGIPTVSDTYHFTITAMDSATPTPNLGSQEYTIAVTFVYQENFDSVTAPALPVGWTVGGTGQALNWKTVTTRSQTLPNSIYVNAVSDISTRYITSPSILIPVSGGTLSFWQYLDLENGYDGGALSIEIDNSGIFVDIITAGGVFITGGYNSFVVGLGNKPGWTGNLGGFFLTSLTLPPSASGHSIRLRWIMGCDASLVYTGWWVDSISIV